MNFGPKEDSRHPRGSHQEVGDSALNPTGGDNIRLPAVVEFAIVGGLGVLIVMGPNIAGFVKKKCQVMKARVIILKERVGQSDLFKKLVKLNRRRKTGSIIRLIGTALPSSMFAPTCRIYIPPWAQLGHVQNQWNYLPQDFQLTAEPVNKFDTPSENLVGDGVIEAFEIASEVLSCVSGDDLDDEEETASSSPEGWTEEQRDFRVVNFNPTLNVTDLSFARCSTPKGNRPAPHFNATQSSQHGNGNASRILEDQTEITELKRMVEGLMLQINCLNQSLITNRGQINFQQEATGTNQINTQMPPVPPAIPVAQALTRPQPGLPPPPPPPPPPMPPMAATGNRPLVITKKGNQNEVLEKKQPLSLTDVLKELPNAKLRRIERSPGGTPIKPVLKLASEKPSLDIGSQLASALKKRFESMHSPVCENENEDKENMDGSDDSFEDNPIAAKRILFPVSRSPRRRSSGSQRLNENGSIPFGQHLLKKRNQENDEPVLPLAVTALREQN